MPLPRVDSLFGLSGKTALVTGGSSGLGLTIAQALAGAGASVVLCARREAELQRACESMRAGGGQAQFVCADLAQRDAWREVAHAAALPFGAPQIIVHAAGMNLRRRWQDVTLDDWDTQIDVMLAAPFFLSRELVPAMAARRWGRIITIASLQSQRAFADSIPYGTAKGGVMQLTRAMSEAWSRDGINCNAIAPGFFRTALTAPVFEDPERCAAIERQTAIGRAGEPADLHGAAIFLASAASDYITGQTLFVDGGFSAK